MGKIVNNTYKNTFEVDDNGILEVYMKSNKLCKEMFEIISRKNSVNSINIFSGNLSQIDFNNLIEAIRLSTEKPTDLAFFPIIKEGEEISSAYQRYISDYRKIDEEQSRHFPDNIFINSSLVETDLENNNLIRANTKKKSF